MGADAQRIWDRAARGYARQEQLERRAVARAVELAAPARGDEVLDLATGTGLVLRELAARSTPPATVVGLDRSSGMLAEIGRLPTGWRTVQGDAVALPFADGSFDVAIASYLLHLLDPPTRRAVLAELHRVVRPGGRLVVVTVWSARWTARAGLAGLAAASEAIWGGLRPLDPRAGIDAAGFRITRAATLSRGYPSLVVLAERCRSVG